MDKSAIMDQLQGIQAILDPDNQFVTLVSTGENNGMRGFKMKTKIRLTNNDASFLQDTSQLDVSRDASYILGDVFAQDNRRTSLKMTNSIFGGNNLSASPSSSPTRSHNLNIPPTP